MSLYWEHFRNKKITIAKRFLPFLKKRTKYIKSFLILTYPSCYINTHLYVVARLYKKIANSTVPTLEFFALIFNTLIYLKYNLLALTIVPLAGRFSKLTRINPQTLNLLLPTMHPFRCAPARPIHIWIWWYYYNIYSIQRGEKLWGDLY